MSLHNKPNYQIPELIEALKAHRLPHDTPSQLADSFRIGWMACRELAQATAAPAAPAGDWLWVKLMDFCKKRGFAPANFNDLFEIVDAARAARTPVDSASWKLLDDVLQTEPDVKAEPLVTDQPYLWVSPEQAANITDHPPGEGGRYLPVRKSCDGKFTEPLYRRPPKPQSYLQERSQLDAEWASLRGMQASFNQGTWVPAEEIKALVRQLDVLLNGEAGAAKQATLGDLVSQVRRIVSVKGNCALLDLLP